MTRTIFEAAISINFYVIDLFSRLYPRQPANQMLPPELLKVVFGALSRDDLDALMLTNALFCDIVLRDFAKEPFRYFVALQIDESYAFGLSVGNYYACRDSDDFNRRMRLARVDSLQ